MWSWILCAPRGELVATAAVATSEGAAVPAPSEEISFLVEPLDEAVRGSQPHRPPTPALGLLPLPGGRKLQGSCPGRQTPALPEPWLHQALLCQISPALGVWAPRGAGWEVRATASSHGPESVAACG